MVMYINATARKTDRDCAWILILFKKIMYKLTI